MGGSLFGYDRPLPALRPAQSYIVIHLINYNLLNSRGQTRNRARGCRISWNTVWEGASELLVKCASGSPRGRRRDADLGARWARHLGCAYVTSGTWSV